MTSPTAATGYLPDIPRDRQRLAEVTSYAEAQRLVDRLPDAGFEALA